MNVSSATDRIARSPGDDATAGAAFTVGRLHDGTRDGDLGAFAPVFAVLDCLDAILECLVAGHDDPPPHHGSATALRPA